MSKYTYSFHKYLQFCDCCFHQEITKASASRQGLEFASDLTVSRNYSSLGYCDDNIILGHR